MRAITMPARFLVAASGAFRVVRTRRSSTPQRRTHEVADDDYGGRLSPVSEQKTPRQWVHSFAARTASSTSF